MKEYVKCTIKLNSCVDKYNKNNYPQGTLIICFKPELADAVRKSLHELNYNVKSYNQYLDFEFERCDELDITVLQLNEEFTPNSASVGITSNWKFYGISKAPDDATPQTINATIKDITYSLYEALKKYARTNSGIAGV